ncbi:MAG: nicotinate (nicotinamide) nucleotide adenylyltransferase [Ignavibacteria bacterium]|nr:nicotinate (nicotinamide) nucleotide adenylyltransferase [Ignavibacteria bacterium]
MPQSEHRIGIIGGSFNPIHIAHLIIADRFVDQLHLDACYFVPAFQSPFKVGDKGLASPTDRVAMVKLAIEQHPMFHVSTAEVDRQGVSYTIDTLQTMSIQNPGAVLHLLIGSDQAVEFVRWKDWQDICRIAQLCIVRRPFLLTPEQEQRMTEQLTIDGRPPIWVQAPLLEISSTDIRSRVADDKSINYQTVKAVRDYIDAKKLYRK